MKNLGKIFLFVIFLISLFFNGCANRSVEGGGGDKSNNEVTSPTHEPVPPSTQTAIATPTPAKTESNILFVIDSSGSMKAQVEEKTKMDTAKQVFNDLAETLPTDSKIGLLAYGHRSKNDCKDTELLITISPFQADLFRQKVQSLQPLGQTPISYSLRQAAENLQGKSGIKSIVLISDGEETCREDPCEVAAELKKAEIELKIHVIGFGIEKAETKKQLTCIAEATGGTYKDAANAEELKTTLKNATGGGEVTSNKGRLVTISLNSYGNPVDWKVQVFTAGSKDNRIADNLDATRINELPPGVYDLYYWATGFQGVTRKNVEIKAGEETRISFETYGRLKILHRDENGKIVNTFPEVYRNGERYLSFSSEKTQELEPGIYDIQTGAMSFSGISRKGVEVKPGQETLIEITLTK